MVLRFNLLIITLLLSLTAFSQTAINANKVITISRGITLSHNTAKRVAVDLVRGDSAIAELQATQSLLALKDRKIVKQDSLINTYTNQLFLLNKQIDIYDEKDLEYKKIIVELEKDNQKQRRINKILSIVASVFFTSTLTLGLTL